MCQCEMVISSSLCRLCIEHVYQAWSCSCRRKPTCCVGLLPVTLCFTVNGTPDLMVAIINCVVCYVQKVHFSSINECVFSVNKCTLMEAILLSLHSSSFGMSQYSVGIFCFSLPQKITTILLTDLHPIIITIFPIRVYLTFLKFYLVNVVHTCRNLCNFMVISNYIPRHFRYSCWNNI
jgi:hypothetical protein